MKRVTLIVLQGEFKRPPRGFMHWLCQAHALRLNAIGKCAYIMAAEIEMQMFTRRNFGDGTVWLSTRLR